VSARDVIGQVWAAYTRWWGYLVPLALAAYLGLGAFAVLVVLLAGPLGLFSVIFIFVVGYAWIQGVLVRAIDDIQTGEEDLWIGTRLARLRPRMNALSVGTLFALAGIAAGCVFFLVPGLVLATWWALLVPVCVLEGQGGWSALGRSRQLVRGHGSLVFRALLLSGLLTGIATKVVGAAGALLPTPSAVSGILTDVLGTGIVAPFAALTTAILYYELRGGSSLTQGRVSA